MEVNELKSLLSRFGIRPNKLLGQNFLLSDEVLEQIVEAADLSERDTVLEIGPGLGFLTRKLAEKAGLVLAVEKDRKLCRALRKIFKNRKNIHPVKSVSGRPPLAGFNRVKVINDDALFFDFSVILSLPKGDEESRSFAYAQDDTIRNRVSYKVVANIPYYLTGKILQKFLSSHNSSSPPLTLRGGAPSLRIREGRGELRKPSLIVLLLQKEVAERIVAKPGEMSILAVSVQFYADPEIIAYVPKENFYPMPEVDSAIVRLRVLDKPRVDVDEKKFFQLVKIGFSNKRKQLKNNLQVLPRMSFSGLTRESRIETEKSWIPDQVGNDRSIDYKKLLASLDINPLARAQDLSLEEWKRLYDRIWNIVD